MTRATVQSLLVTSALVASFVPQSAQAATITATTTAPTGTATGTIGGGGTSTLSATGTPGTNTVAVTGGITGNGGTISGTGTNGAIGTLGSAPFDMVTATFDNTNGPQQVFTLDVVVNFSNLGSPFPLSHLVNVVSYLNLSDPNVSAGDIRDVLQQATLWTGFNATGSSLTAATVFAPTIDPFSLDLGPTQYNSLELIDSFTLSAGQKVDLTGFTSVDPAPAPSGLVMLLGFAVSGGAVRMLCRRFDRQQA
jgi:hypothetical protein